MDDETYEQAELTPEQRTRTVCAQCGTVADQAPATWACSVENGTRRYFCDACARNHLRAIESRLDSAWW